MVVSITIPLLWRFNTKWYSGRERCEALVSCLINVYGTDFQVHRASIFHTTYRARLLTSPCTPGHLLPTPSGNRPYPTPLLPSTRNKPELSVLDRSLPSKSGQAVVNRKSRPVPWQPVYEICCSLIRGQNLDPEGSRSSGSISWAYVLELTVRFTFLNFILDL